MLGDGFRERSYWGVELMPVLSAEEREVVPANDESYLIVKSVRAPLKSGVVSETGLSYAI